jgi:hypothetical protein
MKRIKLVVLLVGVFLVLSLKGPAWGQSDGLPYDVITRGFLIAPVPLNLPGKDPELVGLGSYVVNAIAGCSGCHTNPEFAPGGDPYMGQPERINTANYLAGGTAFGPFKSRNITPDLRSGRPADMTFEEFVETMRTGRDHDMLHPQFGPLLQVMPWSAYKNMSDRYLRAIYVYLSAIPHAEPRP